MATYERLDYGSPDGSHWGGASTDALGLYGVTPVTQYVDLAAASTYLTTSTGNAANTTWGFISSAHITDLIDQVSSMNAAGRRLGLWT
jgi:hypothetical protein